MYRNSEHYFDPTAGEALSNVRREERKRKKIESGEWFMKWVYIASPYRGDVEINTMRAKRYSRFAARQSVVPICPHIYLTQFLDDNVPEEREAGLYLGIQMLKRCSEIWVFGSKLSEGMAKEIEFAKKNNIPIRYFDHSCKEVKHHGN
jgi:hypothetical protein